MWPVKEGDCGLLVFDRLKIKKTNDVGQVRPITTNRRATPVLQAQDRLQVATASTSTAPLDMPPPPIPTLHPPTARWMPPSQ